MNNLYYEKLKAGMPLDVLIKEISKDLEEAQEAYEKDSDAKVAELEQASARQEARALFINALCKYCIGFGIKEPDEEDVQNLEQEMVKFEEQLKDLIEVFKSNPKTGLHLALRKLF